MKKYPNYLDTNQCKVNIWNDAWTTTDKIKEIIDYSNTKNTETLNKAINDYCNSRNVNISLEDYLRTKNHSNEAECKTVAWNAVGNKNINEFRTSTNAQAEY